MSLPVNCCGDDRDERGNDVLTRAEEPCWNNKAVKANSNSVAAVAVRKDVDVENRIYMSSTGCLRKENQAVSEGARKRCNFFEKKHVLLSFVGV